MSTLFIFLAALIAGGAAGYVAQTVLAKRRQEGAADKAKQLVEDARSEANDLLLSAKEKAVRALSEIKKEEQLRRKQLDKMEERLERTEENLNRKERESKDEWDSVKRKAQEIEKIK